MEGVQTGDRNCRCRSSLPDNPYVASSRRRVLERLISIIHQGVPRPVLLTGEPGAGKTWLTHRLLPLMTPQWRVVHVGVAGAMDGIEFLRLVGHSLGMAMPDRLGRPGC